ncbi:hypothetical protein KI387_039144 [Taxus chinensis]|uniref:Uncharacterized protein n=1 Tax=Taxus chinensis TaxID=29808 RepID=A0AA38FBQ6_TAXCH|nr:hypothetical protein KI387_039144 [Taxus chinensis]
MKLDGQVMKVKEPVTVDEILVDYPGYVILHSDAVRHMGVKAKPLDGCVSLNAKYLYFLVELPKVENLERGPRRVRSGIHMNAKSKLESMLLVRRSISDISVTNHGRHDPSSSEIGEDNGAVRIKVRMTKARLAEIMAESEDSSETAKRIAESLLKDAKTLEKEKEKVNEDEEQNEENCPWKPSLGSIPETCRETQGNRVRFRSTLNEVF